MDSLEALDREIAELKRQLRARLAAKKALEKLSPALQEKRGRFTGMRTINAIRLLLKENGGPMPEDEIVKALVAGGITVGRKRDHHNVRISLETSEKIGVLIRKDGIISLPPS